MAKRVLAIGVGGSGKATLTILKERLEEAYGQVPDNVILLSLDTDNLRDADRFAGTRLNPVFDDRNRLPEFQHVVSPGGMTMDTVFADIRNGKTAAFMSWLEHEKLDRMLSPAERDIRGGAQQRRPIGRTALFLRYANPVSQSIVDAITRVYGDPEKEQPLGMKAEDIEKSKRLIFIIGSVAGGTGSGMLLDVANLVRHAINTNQNWQSISVSSVIVLPDAFASYTRFMDDPTNLKPNSYAALREMDRFMRVHSSFQPYMVRYAEREQSITWSTNQPVDHVYLVDTASRSASQDFDLSGDPMKGVFPVIADFLMSHVDNSLGDALATLRSNAGLHYDKGFGRMYSSFNVMSYIFPVEDVIESFAYRFLREIIVREFLPIQDNKQRAQLVQEAQTEVERQFTTSMVAGRANPNVIQKSIVATKRINPETPDMSWGGLFGLISLSDSGFAEHYQSLQQSLDYLRGNLVLTRDGDYKREGFEDGAVRLRNVTEQFLDDFLGPQTEEDDPESRLGGDWDRLLSLYRDALRGRFAQVLDAALLDALNRRDPQRLLLPSRLPYAQMLAATLKQHLVSFKKLLEEMWRQQGGETRLRQVSEEVRNAFAWMNDTKSKTYLPPFMTEPRRAQESFTNLFSERMELLLHQRIYRTVVDVLDSLGASEKDTSGQKSVIDVALQEIESWTRTLQDVDRVIIDGSRSDAKGAPVDGMRKHESNRNEKRTVKVRRYMTSPELEDQLYKRPEHAGAAIARILGQIGDQKGLEWQRLDDQTALDFKLVTTWGQEARGAEEIARTWFAGAKEVFKVVRNSVTIAERLTSEFNNSSASFTNRCLLVEEPFLRYNPSKNDVSMFRERYVSFNLEKAREDASRSFLENARATLRDQGFNVDTSAEDVMACTVVEISRGVSLAAVELYGQCEPEYRAKLSRGRESIHLFPEEQYATELEQSIPVLGETNNQQRALSPELVIAMGNQDKLRAFVMACAYGVVYEDVFTDPDTNQESTELWLRLNQQPPLPLSQSKVVRALDPRFANLPQTGQLANLHLNALQNFMLKQTELPGFNTNLIEAVKSDLSKRGVSLSGVENPFTLKLSAVNSAINSATLALGPSTDEVPEARLRQARNADARLRILEPYVQNRVAAFKNSVDPRIRDMGTAMHLILREEIQRLRAMTTK